ncbi:hypothetical protein MNAN1_001917 [Malassezia nana]|uniref:Uncharacterized protein n=1 Tax=Malassezia nana TaxID=180528 RepID=A0AAF0EM70_9BASI|nr:hypothetical protein MNAN1_001917 [Malassezia nana]
MDAPPPSYEDAVGASLADASAAASRPVTLVDPPVPPAEAPRLPPRPSAPSSLSTPQAPPPSSPSPSAARPPTAPAPLGPLPTREPRWGHPLLHHNKLLVYPRYWTVCERCHNTGYKHLQSLSPCGRCWRKFGREYAGALRAAYERPGTSTDLSNVHLQRPLTKVPNTAPFPMHVPPPPAPASFASPVVDQDPYSHAPPHYEYASQTRPPQPLPPPTYSMPVAAPAPAWGPPAGRVGPTIDWYGYGPPPGAVTVLPGDPRIGGVLCPACGGRGTRDDLFSFFFQRCRV